MCESFYCLMAQASSMLDSIGKRMNMCVPMRNDKLCLWGTTMELA